METECVCVWGVTVNENKISLGIMEDLWNLIVVMVTHPYKYTKAIHIYTVVFTCLIINLLCVFTCV